MESLINPPGNSSGAIMSYNVSFATLNWPRAEKRTFIKLLINYRDNFL